MSQVAYPIVLFTIALTAASAAGAGPGWTIDIPSPHDGPVFLHLPATLNLNRHQPGDRVLLRDNNGATITGQLERVRPDQPDLQVLARLPADVGNTLEVTAVEPPSPTPPYSTTHSSDGLITLFAEAKPIAVYHLDLRPIPTNEKYNQCNFFHPLCTPSLAVVTDDAPSDHLHHRGLFLAFTKVTAPDREGNPVTANFWQPDPRARIAPGRLHDARNGDVAATFAATHDFLIDDRPVLTQTVIAAATQLSDKVNLLDLTILITPVTDGVTLGDNFYSALQLRGARDFQRPQLMFTYADAKEHRDVDDHKEDPPADRWFDMTGLIGDRLAGAAIAPHPDTPASRLCYARGVKGINADFVYDQPMPLTKGQPLVCKYQIYMHDDHVAAARIADLAAMYNPGVKIAQK